LATITNADLFESVLGEIGQVGRLDATAGNVDAEAEVVDVEIRLARAGVDLMKPFGSELQKCKLTIF
jgi:hypothetical protein